MNTRAEEAAAAVDALEHRLLQIAQRLTPCPIPDVTEGWDLCGHGLAWPCPTTEAAWIARGLDRDQQIHAHTSCSAANATTPTPA